MPVPYQALSKAKKSPHRLIVGPWTHGAQGRSYAGEFGFPPEAGLNFNESRLRWFERWLKGVENGVEQVGAGFDVGHALTFRPVRRARVRRWLVVR